jgi:hypothetical protein
VACGCDAVAFVDAERNVDESERVRELLGLLAPHRRRMVEQHDPDAQYLVAAALLELQLQVDSAPDLTGNT